MARKPHYIPGKTRMNYCLGCGEWLPVVEFRKNQNTCRACETQKERELYAIWWQGSHCAKCEHLDYCQKIKYTNNPMIPFPCDGGPLPDGTRVPLYCAHCGAYIGEVHGRQKYCNNACKVAAYKARKELAFSAIVESE